MRCEWDTACETSQRPHSLRESFRLIQKTWSKIQKKKNHKKWSKLLIKWQNIWITFPLCKCLPIHLCKIQHTKCHSSQRIKIVNHKPMINGMNSKMLINWGKTHFYRLLQWDSNTTTKLWMLLNAFLSLCLLCW